MDIEESADVPSQKQLIANDNEAGSSKSVADKYHQPRWYPSGLTHTQKRKLQRLRNKEKKEQEKEKMGMRTSTDTGPCSLRARFGRSRQLISQPDRSDRHSDRSDRSDRPVRPL